MDVSGAAEVEIVPDSGDGRFALLPLHKYEQLIDDLYRFGSPIVSKSPASMVSAFLEGDSVFVSDLFIGPHWLITFRGLHASSSVDSEVLSAAGIVRQGGNRYH